MYTPGSRQRAERRIRSPRSAPRENGLDGSTETTPTVRSVSLIWAMSAPMRLDFPTPGGPVTPTIAAFPVSGYTSRTSGYASGSPSSTSEIARASARRSPPRTPVTSSSSVSSFRAMRRTLFTTRFGFAAGFDLLEEGRDPLKRWCVLPVSVVRLGLVRRCVSVRECRDRGLGARLDGFPLRVLCHGQPAGHDQGDDGGEQIETPGRDPDGARAEGVGEHSGRGHREADDRVVRAHDGRECAAAILVRRAALDEQAIAHDDRAVARGSADHEGDGEPDRPGERSRAPPHSHED